MSFRPHVGLRFFWSHLVELSVVGRRGRLEQFQQVNLALRYHRLRRYLKFGWEFWLINQKNTKIAQKPSNSLDVEERLISSSGKLVTSGSCTGLGVLLFEQLLLRILTACWALTALIRLFALSFVPRSNIQLTSDALSIFFEFQTFQKNLVISIFVFY